MRKCLIPLLLVFPVFHIAAQKQRTVNVYLQGQVTQTLYDITKGNNPYGFGLGAQAFLNTKSKFKATLEFTGDAYMYDDKVLRSREISPGVWDYDSEIPDVPAMVNLFAGASWHPTKLAHLSATVGPSFIGGNTYLGFKSSFGLSTPNQSMMGKLSFINIFNRDFPTQKDFGSVSISLSFRIH